MTQPTAPSLYLRLRKSLSIGRGEAVTLGQVAVLFTEPEMEADLQTLELVRPQERDGSVVLIDMMQIVRKIKGVYPLLQIEHFGEPHVLVEIHEKTRPPNLAVIVLVWVLLFVGSGLAIMNFHADVSMAAVHRHIYRLLTGEERSHPLVLQIPYSIGIGIGMVLFFNHLFQKKFNEEPSPLEVEMFLYQENINRFVVTEEYRKLHPPGERDEQ